MDCPSCGHANASDRVECSQCEALLVDIFAAKEEQTDPIRAIGKDLSVEDDVGDDSGNGFTRFPTDIQYSGDLPRLFRFGNRYQVLEKLGEGGMGRVYKALDLELDRPIALKTIRTEKGRGPEVLQRFKQELVLARKITHKNVVRIYDLGEAEGGLKFFTMELVEGQSLRDLLNEKKTIPTREAISFMKQMLSGLAEAHSQGVVHRDLKPQNIMVDGNGLLRIMDFGIARTADTATLTGTGEMVGTPDYISPEQVKGENTTAQSDLFAAGVILYELLTGEVPFKGDTAIAKVVARLQVKPTPPRTLNPQIPAYLERIIIKLMEVDLDLRYKTADEVLQDLEREQVDGSLWKRTRKTLWRHRGWIAAVFVGSLGVGMWLLLRSQHGEGHADVTTIAVLPFHNTTGNAELEWMENGLPEMITTDISQLRTLRPVLTDRIRSILQELAKENDTRLDEQSIQMISEMSRADYALSGQFIVSEGRLRIDLTLKSATHGLDAAIKVEGTSSAVFSLVDEITTKVSEVLEIDSRGEANRPLMEVSTSSIEAFRAYNQGLQELQRGANHTAISSFEEATRLDPQFAMAHARLAEALFNLGNDVAARQSIRQARAAAEKNPLPLVEGYQLHAIASRIEDDPDAAVTSYRELARLYPGDPGVRLGLATALENLGSVEEATQLYREVLAQAPQYGAAMLGLGRMLVLAGRNDEAVSVLEKALESGRFEDDPETMGMIHSILGVAQRDLGRPELAIEQQEKSLEFRRQAGDGRGITAALTNLSILYIDNGDLTSAERLLDEGLSRARTSANATMESFVLINLALLNERAGDINRALDVASESMEIEWERKEHTELAGRLDFIGRIYASMGRYADAMVYLEQAKVHIAVSEEPRERGHNELHRGNVLFAKGSLEDALGALLKSVASYREAKDREGAGWALNSLARLYLSQGRFRDARAALDQSEELSRQLGNPRLAATTHLNNARLLIKLGDFAGSDMALQKAEEVLSQMKSHDLHGLFHLVAGEAAIAQRNFDDAQRHFAASSQAKDRDSLLVGLESSIKLGDAQRMAGNRKNAITSLEASWKHSLEFRLPVIQAHAALALAHAHFEQGNLDLARKNLEESIRLAEGFGGMPLLQEGYRLSGLVENKAGRTKEAALALARVSEIDLWLRDQLPIAAPAASKL